MGAESVVSLLLQGEDQGFGDVLSSADEALGGVGANLASLATVGGAVGAIVAIGGALNEAADFAGDINDELTTLEIRTGASQEEMEKLRGTALNIRSVGLGDDFADVAQSLGTVQAITKLTGDDLTNTTEKAIVLRDVFDADVTETIRASDTAMEQFGTTSTETLDLITRGFQQTGDPAGDLLDTVNEYSGDFAEAGFGADEFFGILAAGADAGAFNLDKVADSVREFSTRIVDGSDTTRQALDDIGIGADNLYDQFQSGNITVSESLSLVIGRLQEIQDPIEQDAAGVALFGSLWEDLGPQIIFALDEGKNALGEYEGAADAAFDAATSGLNNTAQRADAAKEELKLLLGEALLPIKTQFLEGAVAILSSTEALAEAVVVTATAEERYEAASEAIANVVRQSELLTDAQGGATQSIQVSNELLFLAGERARDAKTETEAYTIQTQLLTTSISLLQSGFSGTTVELIELAEHLNESLNTTLDLGIGVNDLSDEELALQERLQTLTPAVTSNTLAIEDKTIAVNTLLPAEEHAALVAENFAVAQESLRQRTEDATTAISALRAEMGQGFSADLQALEAGEELAGFNEVIRESIQDTGAGAITMAAFELSIGDASEEAVIGALRMQLFEQGVKAIAESAAADGQITRDELGGIIEDARELSETLNEDFTFAFNQEGAEGVLSTAEGIQGELEGLIADEYNVNLTANTTDAETTISTARTNLLAFEDDLFTATVDADTTGADEGLSGVQTQLEDIEGAIWTVELDDNTEEIDGNLEGTEGFLTQLVTPVYDIVMDSNSAFVQGRIGELQGALNDLAGSVYTFIVRADTSQVPPWAIPESPLPIHTAFMNFVDDVNKAEISPKFNVGNTGPNASGAELLGGGGTTTIVFSGDVIVGREDNAASKAFMALLRNQLRVLERSNF